METSAIEVTPVRTGKERTAFVKLPWAIYKDDPAWCAPLLMEEKNFISPKHHPFYRHGQAALFLAKRGGQVVGRIMVSDDPLCNAEHGTNAACFGLFECVDDQAVADALFARAGDWARALGRDQLRGPIDYSTNYPVGLLLDTFHLPQRIQMKHNPAYYVQLLERHGFAPIQDLYSWWGDSGQHHKIGRWREKIERVAARSEVTIRHFDRKNKARDIALIKELALELLTSNWSYVRMTEAEYRYFIKNMDRIPPELVLIAEHQGKAVGLAVTVPDYNEAIRTLKDGRLTSWLLPLGLVKLLRGIRGIKSARMALLGVREDYRFQGIAERMILRTFDHGDRVLGYTGAELGWTFANNHTMVASIDAVCGRENRRTFRVFQRSLAH